MACRLLNNVSWEKLGDLPLIVFGDLNARTGSDNTTKTNNDYCETFDIFATNDGSSVDELTKRVSEDDGVDEFGK